MRTLAKTKKVKTYGAVGKHFNNKMSTLKKTMDKEIRKEMIKIGETTVKKIVKYIDKNWYKVYDPEDYKRTGSLKDAVRYTIDSKKKLRIYFDRRYFQTKKVNNGQGWQPHRGFDGQVFIDGLIDFINEGGNGGSPNNPRRLEDGIDFIGYAEKVINEYLDKEVERTINVIMKKYL